MTLYRHIESVHSTLDSRSGLQSLQKRWLLLLIQLPFGLCNVPYTLQWLMERILAGLQEILCTVYLDDILVMGGTFEEHS